jgi:hypothetical protein
MLRRSLRLGRASGLAALVFLTLADVASAQFISDLVKRTGVGVTLGVVKPVDDHVDASPVLGVTFGLAPSPGWSWAGSLGWFTGDLLLDDGSGGVDVGRVRVRPLMGGIGYTWVTGKLASTVSLTAGVSFNAADVDESYQQVFGPGTDVSIQMDNSFAVRPGIDLEYTLSPKWALIAYSNFFITTINSELHTPVGRFEDEWNATSFQTAAGVVFYPFRK